MPRKVTKIPEAVQQVSVENMSLRVAAYCRVSTKHEEQQHSLAAQINTTPITFKTIPIGYWSKCILILHPEQALIDAPVIRSS